ncbi:UNKNOWN [Stylonychia lemnae]|uniref:Uncharacterized protein n=1 Tax=Stylonychia lemnae TaxID=5949 RepID=A0A078B3V1_STYLE|nr:UNKNOWN [Stylonychia lemnae]|eukprot:CDW87872.1 UNKNOWN [Stylonychia lemnae]
MPDHKLPITKPADILFQANIKSENMMELYFESLEVVKVLVGQLFQLNIPASLLNNATRAIEPKHIQYEETSQLNYQTTLNQQIMKQDTTRNRLINKKIRPTNMLSLTKIQNQMTNFQKDPQAILVNVKYDQTQNIILRKNPLVIENGIWRTSNDLRAHGNSVRSLQYKIQQHNLAYQKSYQSPTITKHDSTNYECLYHFLGILKDQTDKKLKQLSSQKNTITSNVEEFSPLKPQDSFLSLNKNEQPSQSALRNKSKSLRNYGRNQRPFSATVGGRINPTHQKNNQSFSQNEINKDKLNTSNRSQNKRGGVLQGNSLTQAYKQSINNQQMNTYKNLKNIFVGNSSQMLTNLTLQSEKDRFNYQEGLHLQHQYMSSPQSSLSNKQILYTRVRSPKIQNHSSHTPGINGHSNILNQDLNQMLIEEEAEMPMMINSVAEIQSSTYHSQRISRPASKYKKRQLTLQKSTSKISSGAGVTGVGNAGSNTTQNKKKSSMNKITKNLLADDQKDNMNSYLNRDTFDGSKIEMWGSQSGLGFVAQNQNGQQDFNKITNIGCGGSYLLDMLNNDLNIA